MLQKRFFAEKSARSPSGYYFADEVIQVHAESTEILVLPEFNMTVELGYGFETSSELEVASLIPVIANFTDRATGAELGYARFNVLSRGNGTWDNVTYLDVLGGSDGDNEFYDMLVAQFQHVAYVLDETPAVAELAGVEFKLDSTRKGQALSALLQVMRHLSKCYDARLFIYQVWPLQFMEVDGADRWWPTGTLPSTAKQFNQATSKLKQCYLSKLRATALGGIVMATVFDLDLTRDEANYWLPEAIH